MSFLEECISNLATDIFSIEEKSNFDMSLKTLDLRKLRLIHNQIKGELFYDSKTHSLKSNKLNIEIINSPRVL